MRVGPRSIGPGFPCFVVAEIGSNHDGSLPRALELITRCAEAGADAVKFQSISYRSLYVDDRTPAGVRELIRSLEFPEDWYPSLASTAERHGVLFFSAPTYPEVLPVLESCGVRLYKIASPQAIGDPRLVRAVARLGKPIVLSTGYGSMEEIHRSIHWCREVGNESVVLLHCVSRYPCPAHASNVKAVESMASALRMPVGFSDHTVGDSVALAAVALGACVIEKHVTDDRTRTGPDHHFAMEVDEFAAMVHRIRDVEQALGTGDRDIPEPEMLSSRGRIMMRLVAIRDLPRGHVVSEADLMCRRAPEGILAVEEPAVLGRTLGVPVLREAPLRWENMTLAAGAE